jgi:hypothetical protein
MSRNGSISTTLRSAISKVDAFRTPSATNGIASWLTWLPSWLTVSADQSLRKSG